MNKVSVKKYKKKPCNIKRLFSCCYKNKNHTSLCCKFCKTSDSKNIFLCEAHKICSTCLKKGKVSNINQNIIDCNCKNFIKCEFDVSLCKKNHNLESPKYQEISTPSNQTKAKSEYKVNLYFADEENDFEISKVKPENLIRNINSVDFNENIEQEVESKYLQSENEVNSQEISFDNEVVLVNDDAMDSKMKPDNNDSMNDIMIFLSKCLICGSKEEIKGFVCNHNICESCLSCQFAETVSSFNLENQKGNEDNLKFELFCPVLNCHKKLCVPSMMMINKIRKLLKNESFRIDHEDYLCFEKDWVIDWIPFFDGIQVELA